MTPSTNASTSHLWHLLQRKELQSTAATTASIDNATSNLWACCGDATASEQRHLCDSAEDFYLRLLKQKTSVCSATSKLHWL